VHVFLDQVHGDVARALVHDLHGFGPALDESAPRFECRELLR
jgi:hypothetical protein